MRLCESCVVMLLKIVKHYIILNNLSIQLKKLKDISKRYLSFKHDHIQHSTLIKQSFKTNFGN